MKVEVPVSKSFLAGYNGRCSGCKGAIRKGEEIVEVVATKEWVHPECVPVEDKPELKW